MTTAYVRTGDNKWEQLRTSGQPVGHCGGRNVKQQTESTPVTTTRKEEIIKSTKILGTKVHADSTQLGFLSDHSFVMRT